MSIAIVASTEILFIRRYKTVISKTTLISPKQFKDKNSFQVQEEKIKTEFRHCQISQMNTYYL